MKIGIISDTHNKIELTQKAVEVFKVYNIELLVHAGDLNSPKMLEIFKDFQCKIVLGNTDIDEEEMNQMSEQLGLGCIKRTCTFEVEGKSFIVFHGDNVPEFREAVRSGKYNYIIKGHTHFFENYVSNNSRVINPGCLYRGEECSVAILDTDTDIVEMIIID